LSLLQVFRFAIPPGTTKAGGQVSVGLAKDLELVSNPPFRNEQAAVTVLLAESRRDVS
jgi:hypothetical protein